MPIHSFRPLTPSGRFTSLNMEAGLSKERPQRALTTHKHKSGGRNVYGRVTSRHRGGGHKQLYRIIDFHRDVLDLPAKVQAIEYDPNRSANIALVAYTDGVKKYIIAPKGLKAGDTIVASDKATTNDFKVGNNFPLHLIAVEHGKATLKMPSGELRMLHANCRATIGEVGNGDHNQQSLGKAGRARWLGRRPHVRGVAMNPVDHPNGGGQGKSKGGGGRQHLVSPWGQLAKGFVTRRRSKLSTSMIITHHNGRKPRNKK